MPINPDAVGSTGDPTTHSWTSKDAILYALGVGADTDELPFTTENTAEVDQRVLPTMAVVIGAGGGGGRRIGTFDPAMLVHGEQSVELFSEIPVSGSVSTVAEIVGIYDKGKGALVVTESTSTNAETGEALFKNRVSAFIRGEGGWGGDRGPSGPQNVAPEREPDHVVTYPTRVDQALLYRLSGDRNPLHSDPSFAARAGFPKPILHGLCTFGFAGRALLHAVCGGDPSRFARIDGRFSSPVFPGESLTVKVWSVDGGEGDRSRAVFQTSADDGRVVLDGGLFEYRG
jgi:acyl dehydratase